MLMSGLNSQDWARARELPSASLQQLLLSVCPLASPQSGHTGNFQLVGSYIRAGQLEFLSMLLLLLLPHFLSAVGLKQQECECSFQLSGPDAALHRLEPAPTPPLGSWGLE